MPVCTRELTEPEARQVARAAQALIHLYGGRDPAADHIGIAHGTLTTLAAGRPRGAYYPRSLEALAGAVGCSTDELLAGHYRLAVCGRLRLGVTAPAARQAHRCAA